MFFKKLKFTPDVLFVAKKLMSFQEHGDKTG